MTSFQAIILGILQGLGEFLPVSSSAHLALVPLVSGWQYQGLSYDVMLHAGTLCAALLYFWKDWLEMLKGGAESIQNLCSKKAKQKAEKPAMLWLIALATVPAGIFGIMLNTLAETTLRGPKWIAASLILFSALIFYADKTARQNKADSKFTIKHALLIGLAQCLALIPGASRSAMTISAALLLGYSRQFSAKFSFLLSAPVIGGAALLKAAKLSAAEITWPFILGIVAAFLTGLLVIKFFMYWLKNHGLMPFIIYRIMLGIAILFATI